MDAPPAEPAYAYENLAPGGGGRYAAAIGGYRFAVSAPSDHPDAADQWIHLTVGAGWIGYSGHDSHDSTQDRYDLSSLVVTGRFAFVAEHGVFAVAPSLEVLGAPKVGYAIVPTFALGLSF